MELIKEGKLILEKDWVNNINILEKEVKEVIKGKEKAVKIVKSDFVKAVNDSFPDEKFGILFSGGIDSTLIAFLAKKAGKDFVCYSVGLKRSDELKGADDLFWSKKIAKEYGFDLKVVELGVEGFEKIIEKVTKILGEPDVVKIGVGVALYPGMEKAKKDGLKYIYSGLGSEEIFAGYQRHEESKDINKECWNGLKKMWGRDFTRDTLLAEKLGLTLKIPFLDKKLIVTAMGVDSSLKMNAEYKKLILRYVAEEVGLKKEFCWRKKKAAQYGSKADKVIAKLTKKKGFKLKKDYVKSLLV
ncbi:asparagine synthase C-terminal domain-containing protein [Candidatus Woesearchaeota archaeon]|nr:asparagine synthase C-terminal domain-containing protein [Candidatus Woesearchaeota archaeon]